MAPEQASANVRIYKIVERLAWDEAERCGRFAGSADDARDGFIHLSTATQVAATLAKHFSGRDNLVLVEIDAGALGDALRWETSRGGALFPHLYAPLELSAVVKQMPIELDGSGRHRLPRELASC